MDTDSRVIHPVKLWLVCLLLALPSLIPVALHFYFSATILDDHPTGFIQNDQPYYMGNARQYFDDGEFSFTHKNPCDWRADSPKIYFQPQTLFLGALQEFSGIDPAFLFCLFGFVFALLTIRIAWSMLNEFLPPNDGSSVHVFGLFIWGGGLFAVAGLASMLLTPKPNFDIYDYLTMYDPFQGWWFLNLGRNFVFPMESYYHFLFLSGSLLLVRGKHWSALAIGLLLSVSHPFTGVEFLAIMFGWMLLERVFWLNDRVGWAKIATAFVLVVAHVAYYQVWLNGFPAHRALHEVWELAWEYKAVNMILGYGLVAAIAGFTIRNVNLCREFFDNSKHRYLLMWFAVAFLLANHEFFMKSLQPLHFTRGYVWTPLFLAGAATLHHWFNSFAENNKLKLLIPILTIVFIADNASWLCISTIDGRHNSAHTKTDFREVMTVLNGQNDTGAIVVSNSRPLSYFATVYTSHDSFVSHGYLTPNVDENWDAAKKLFENGNAIAVLSEYSQLVVLDSTGSFIEEKSDFEATKTRIQKAYEDADFSVRLVGDSSEFSIWHCQPKAAASLTR